MHLFGEFANHGHSHAGGGDGHGSKCAGGHGHGTHSHEGQHLHGGGEISEEMRAAMLRQLEMQMEMMTSGNHVYHGHMLHDPNSPDPRPYNTLLFGFGHDPVPAPSGWGSLANAPSPLTSATLPLSSADTQKLATPAERNNFWSPRLPVLGRLRIVKDPPGLAQAVFVVMYWIYGTWSSCSAVLLPYYNDGVLPVALLLGKTFFCCYSELYMHSYIALQNL